MKTLKIDDLNKLKITSVRYNGVVIHFNYDNENYTIVYRSEEDLIELCKGRMKGHLELISWCVKGYFCKYPDFIKYKYNKKTLSSIDKEHFVKELSKKNLIEEKENNKK